MCTLVIAWKMLDEVPCIVLANRDEGFARPTQALHTWPNGIRAGKDLEAGGTWMGVGPQGQFAALTNVRLGFDQTQAYEQSRGLLVERALLANNIEETKNYLNAESSKFAPFNLMFMHNDQLYHYNNHSQKMSKLERGIYAVSNADLDSPWPKVELVKTIFKTHIENYKETQTIDKTQLIKQMQNRDIYPDSQLPDTNIPLEWERMLSALCIDITIKEGENKGKRYGTRLTSLFLLNQLNEWDLSETIYE
jgi:uncharacterized protein with NRDE domain